MLYDMFALLLCMELPSQRLVGYDCLGRHKWIMIWSLLEMTRMFSSDKPASRTAREKGKVVNR